MKGWCGDRYQILRYGGIDIRSLGMADWPADQIRSLGMAIVAATEGALWVEKRGGFCRHSRGAGGCGYGGVSAVHGGGAKK
jgi:hypothetical protein